MALAMTERSEPKAAEALGKHKKNHFLSAEGQRAA
jgi:hypothetical protein